MRAVVQRVTGASVTVRAAGEPEVVGAIDRGLVILLGVADGDTEREAELLAAKIARLRIFPDDHKPMNRSLLDIGAAALVVSQFTLIADVSRGNRPSFTKSAPPAIARALYEHFTSHLRTLGVPCETGRFAADMTVTLQNDGPVTFVLDCTPGEKVR